MRARFSIQTFQVVHDAGTTLGKVKTMDDVIPILCAILRYCCDADREHMIVLPIDAHNEVLGFKVVASGTLDQCHVHMRDIFTAAITFKAAAVILAHGYPSQNPSPSKSDYELSERVTKAGEIMGIPILEHVVLPSSGTDRTWKSAVDKSRFVGAK